MFTCFGSALVLVQVDFTVELLYVKMRKEEVPVIVMRQQNLQNQDTVILDPAHGGTLGTGEK